MSEKYKHGLTLSVELQEQGLSIWLENASAKEAAETDAASVREEFSYMRDCVFRSGKLSDA